MEIRKYTVYKFEELSEEGKQRALKQNWDINVDYEWWDFIYDDAEEIGLKITSFDLDRNRHAEGELIASGNEVMRNIIADHGKMCDTYESARVFYSRKHEGRPMDEDEILAMVLEDYSIMLQNEYEYLTGEEAITETLIANEYDFTEDGEID